MCLCGGERRGEAVFGDQLYESEAERKIKELGGNKLRELGSAGFKFVSNSGHKNARIGEEMDCN